MQLARTCCRPSPVLLRPSPVQRLRLSGFQRVPCCPCWASVEEKDGHGGRGKVGKEGRRSRVAVAALVEKQIDKLLSFIMPRERGDVRDVALMSTSIVVFVWAAAMLYRVYAYSYNAAGLRPLIQMFAR